MWLVQVKELNIDNAATLTGVIGQIFDKALLEPTFCELYAQFCMELSKELPQFEQDGVTISFKRTLLNKCQDVFERGVKEEADAEKAEEEVEGEEDEEDDEEEEGKAKEGGEGTKEGEKKEEGEKEGEKAEKAGEKEGEKEAEKEKEAEGEKEGEKEKKGREGEAEGAAPAKKVRKKKMVIRVLSEAERQERRQMARKRVLGNIRFVGELFKMGMLTSKIMHECIRTLISNHQARTLLPLSPPSRCLSKIVFTLREPLPFHPLVTRPRRHARYCDGFCCVGFDLLFRQDPEEEPIDLARKLAMRIGLSWCPCLQNPEEESIESLCKLMMTIGQLIDTPQAQQHMDAYMQILVMLSGSDKLSSRIRFMLKDVIELRRNKWQARRKVEGPKKISEVHRDAVQVRSHLAYPGSPSECLESGF